MYEQLSEKYQPKKNINLNEIDKIRTIDKFMWRSSHRDGYAVKEYPA